jgi:hypothetical protein
LGRFSERAGAFNLHLVFPLWTHRAGFLQGVRVPSPKFILLLTKGLLRDARARRTMMFYTTLGSLVLLFFGAAVLDARLAAHPFWFIVWWSVCAWLMLAAVLLAIFDLLMLRAAARKARRDLAKKILKEQDDENAS